MSDGFMSGEFMCNGDWLLVYEYIELVYKYMC